MEGTHLMGGFCIACMVWHGMAPALWCFEIFKSVDLDRVEHYQEESIREFGNRAALNHTSQKVPSENEVLKYSLGALATLTILLLSSQHNM